MLKEVRKYFASLPENGIGIHGTSSSNADAISKEGLKLNTDNPFIGNWFYHLRPQIAIQTPVRAIYEIMDAIILAWEYATLRTKYRDPQGKPMLVILIPPRTPFYEDRMDKSRSVIPGSDTRPIPVRNILGTLQLPQIPEYDVFDEEIRREFMFENKTKIDEILLQIKAITERNKGLTIQNDYSLLSRIGRYRKFLHLGTK